MERTEAAKQVEVFTLDAFAKGEKGGNPAGVVLQADSMTVEEMQKTAAIVGFSETALLLESSVADFRARYFTPNNEVDLCGHATIAAFSVMFSQGLVGVGTYSLETKAGLLQVYVRENGDVFLSQTLPHFSETVNKQEIADSLRLSVDDFSTDLPLQIVSTGLRDVMVPVKSKEILENIQPNFAKIIEVSKKYEVVGYHVFTLDTGIEALASCRNFAPLYAIPEESATGTSNGALLCYLRKYGKYNPSEGDENHAYGKGSERTGHAGEVRFEQGHTMNQPSEIKAKLTLGMDQQVLEVQVGGATANLAVKWIQL
ncbi:PhzF family phenazine biosynthesis protein [Brevibacillus fortis]|uniref:PhzF family phenazine biosynthesis protein n=1 Tax=Brevibacillus fortis TaxID=2126352 RepID=UPI0038FBF06F